MHCPRCQHENRPQAKFCEECASPFTGASPTARSDADPKSEVENLRRALSETLEQQTATAEILRVISSSPTDVQPVFDAIAEAQRGWETAPWFATGSSRGECLRSLRSTRASRRGDGDPPALVAPRLSPDSAAGRAVLNRQIVHIPDAREILSTRSTQAR